jgi:N-acetylmuramoyl-L-alanine amidase
LSDWIRTTLAALAGLSLLTGAAALPGPPPLAGRVIVIDPGHGGKGDTGAVSSSGLKEAHVNLMVSLRLAEMLRRDGARVILTRTADTFVASDDAVSDLAARAQVANDAQADLFLSIHHNDTLSKSDPKNDTQVYWKLDDQGPSRDFAKILLPRLAGSLQMPNQKLFAGNFAVLRRNRRPAILGEGGYLSNPITAKALRQPATWQKEAAAYAAAIREYFGRGVPTFGDVRWETTSASDAAVRVAATGTPAPTLPERFVLSVDPDGGIMASVQVLVDGEPVGAILDPERNLIVWSPGRPLGNGSHTLRVEARNAAGNAAIPLNGTIVFDRPAARIEAASIPAGWHPDATPAAIIQASVLDGLGLPVADGTSVTLSWGGQTQTVTTKAGRVVTTMPWPAGPQVPLQLVAGAARTAVRFADQASHAHLALTVQGSGSDQPAAAISLDGQALPAMDGTGLGIYEVSPGLHQLAVQARGYEPWESPVTVTAERVHPLTVTLTPRFGGVLIGRRIILDPFTSVERPDVGRRTLALALSLKERLEAAGAQVSLSRTDDVPVDPDERCRQMSRNASELYVGLDVGSGSVAHYYTSIKGSKVARLIVAQQKGLRTSPEASYMVTHSPCTAVVVRALRTDDGTAAGLFEALRRYYTP